MVDAKKIDEATKEIYVSVCPDPITVGALGEYKRYNFHLK